MRKWADAITPWVFVLVLASSYAAPAEANTLHPGDLVIAHKLPDGTTGVLSALDLVSGELTPIASGGLLNGVHSPADQYRSLGDVEITRDGEIFVSNLYSNTIVRVTASTGVSTLIATFPGVRGGGGLGLTPDGNLYYSTGYSDGRDILLHLDLSTSEATEIATGDWLDGGYSLDVDSDGRVFVARENLVTRLDPATGVVSTVIQTELGKTYTVRNPFGVAIDQEGALYFADNGRPALVKLSLGGIDPSPLLDPSGVCQDDPLHCGLYWGVDVSEAGDVAAVIQLRDGRNGVWFLPGGSPEAARFFSLPSDDVAYPWGIAFVPIPEPSTAALLAVGVIALAARQRGRTTRDREPLVRALLEDDDVAAQADTELNMRPVEGEEWPSRLGS